jgi:ubiquinone/menaquinone biosynthesis C-methylase UbiE
MAEERFSGANIVNAGKLSPYWGEHLARYFFALPYVKGKKILDIACGTGYGLAFLSRQAVFSVGVDIDLQAAVLARKEIGSRAAVILGDGTKLPFADESFDVITSFETLEHLYKRGEFLAELKRVLKKDGWLILSTPNAYYTKPVNGKPVNPFHIFEYRPEELRAELENYFFLEQFLGQTLDKSFEIPPLQVDQSELPKGFRIQSKLFIWKVLNKMPVAIRETFSRAIWKVPFFPTEENYNFAAETIEYAPVTVAVCRAAR